jgi:putative proteasome-type protease
VFDSIEDPMWHGEQTGVPLMVDNGRHKTLKKISTPQDKLI